MKLLSQESPMPFPVNFVMPQNIELIDEPIDFAINVSSMQEMPYSSIETYFRFLRKRSHSSSRFYCLNRRRNELIGGEVLEFDKYPWDKKDQIFLHGICPFHTHFFSLRRAFNAYGQPTKGPKIFGWRVPFVNYFDGEAVH